MKLLCRVFCKPAVFSTEGADHVGVDAYLKCKGCDRRGLDHVECERVTPAVVKVLRREWRKGAFA